MSCPDGLSVFASGFSNRWLSHGNSGKRGVWRPFGPRIATVPCRVTVGLIASAFSSEFFVQLTKVGNQENDKGAYDGLIFD